MALVLQPFTEAEITFIDRDKNTKRLPVRYDSALTAGGIATELTGTLIPALTGVSDAVVTGFRFVYSYQEADAIVLGGAPETSDVERYAQFGLLTSYKSPSSFNVPSIKNTLVIDGSNIINMADPLVIALLAAIVPTVPGATTPVDLVGGNMTFSGRAGQKKHRNNPNG